MKGAMRNLAFFAWWGIALLPLGLGFYSTGAWYWAPALAGLAAAWLLGWKKQANLCLAASVLLAALGILLSAPAEAMIAGTAASLGLWDFAAADWRDYRRSRLPLALATIGIGAAAAIIGYGFTVALPFFALLLCVIACAFCVDRAARHVLRR
jgi:hypothetical protein